MPIDFTQVLTNFDGATLTDNTVKDGEPATVPLTLSRAACTALLSNLPNEPASNASEYLSRFLLAMQIKDNPSAEINAEQVTQIKERIARAYANATVAGQATVLLDPDAAAQLAKRVA